MSVMDTSDLPLFMALDSSKTLPDSPDPRLSPSVDGKEVSSNSVPPEVLSPGDKIERECSELLAAVSQGRMDTMQKRVAWILNHYPGTRDSDITLQIEYWNRFEPELGGGEFIQKSDLYKLVRLTSLARARAKIQNTYHLFLPSLEVQEQRGTIEEGERQKAREQKIDYPSIDVFVDESGKTDEHLVVGSLWFLHPPEQLEFLQSIIKWKELNHFSGEFHFKEITANNLQLYLSFLDLLRTRSHVIGFKAISVERKGLNVESAIGELFYHLIVKGIAHEHESGRAQLPRALMLTKDLEDENRDKLFLEGLRDRLQSASIAKFDGKLHIDQMKASSSQSLPLVQLADLFTSSIRRVLAAQGERKKAKDEFANAFLSSFGMSGGLKTRLQEGDMSMLIQL